MPSYENLLRALSEEKKNNIKRLFDEIKFTEMERLEIAKSEADLNLWDEKSFASFAFGKNNKDGRDGKRYIEALRKYMSALRSEETDYSSFSPKWEPRTKERVKISEYPLFITECPCPKDGEETRCCNLNTLDVFKQCAFNCSYCSVQAFYSGNEIEVRENLKKELDTLNLDGTWHIGTGQASDSLLFNNKYGELDALSEYLEKHPELIIELKSKNEAIDYKRKFPRNLIFTWSLNAETIIEKEEHYTASLDKRLLSARRMADNGSLVGFHIHPMVYFKGWEDEYIHVKDEIERLFSPEEILMVSMGTLTFTKSVLKKMREEGRKSRVTEMELSPFAGKYSYPLDTKMKMFKTLYSSFSDPFRENIFFYLCLEAPSLWDKCLKKSYKSNKDFELDMKKHYFDKINRG